MFVKICGLTTEEEVRAAVDAGADAIGFVFARSPRHVEPRRAAELIRLLPDHVEPVAVFRLPDPALLEAVRALPLRLVQADADWERPTEPWLPVLKDGPDLAGRVAALPARSGPGLAGALLIDGPMGGGRGVPADPVRVARVAHERRIVLAGGLTPDNVAHAVRVVRPFGVDVSSGVEERPGVKDAQRIRAFVRAARRAGEEVP